MSVIRMDQGQTTFENLGDLDPHVLRLDTYCQFDRLVCPF